MRTQSLPMLLALAQCSTRSLKIDCACLTKVSIFSVYYNQRTKSRIQQPPLYHCKQSPSDNGVWNRAKKTKDWFGSPIDQYNQQMNIKKILTNFFQEQQKNQPNYQLQRKNAIRLRRRQKSQIFQQGNKQPKMYRFFKPCNQEANASAMKYVESHHPCIKERVIRILSNHRQGNNLNKHETLMAQTAKNDGFFRKGHNIHKQSYCTISYQPSKECLDLSSIKINETMQEIMKPCKISAISLMKRPSTEMRNPINRQTKSKSSIQYSPGIKDRSKQNPRKRHMKMKQHTYFTAWQSDINEMQAFLE